MVEIDSLSPVERKFLKAVVKNKDWDFIKKETGLEDVELVRALNWLKDKDLLEYEKKEIITYEYTSLGNEYLEKGLPERTFVNSLKSPKKASEIKLDKQELGVSIGILKKLKALNVEKKDELVFSLTEEGKKYLEDKLPSEIDFENKDNIKELQKRGLIEQKKKASFTVKNVKITKKLSEKINAEDNIYVEKLTSDMLKKGSWEDKKFRRYSLKVKPPFLDYGRKHFVTESIEYIKNLWLTLGFEELKGDKVQSAFWNMDALFIPQDHPAREMQDTFYVDKKSKIDKKFFDKIKKLHEEGDDESEGWGYKYDKDKAEENLLRTHTTVLTALKLAELKKEDLPRKYFSVDKVYRNEALDWKHLFEFHQVEGIVIDENANFVSLKNYLTEFFKKMGYSDVRFRPAYFPYTEPSAEIDVYHPTKKEWVELGGSGMIRPEIVKALLGFEAKVLAWGFGMERIITSYYNISDLREIYNNDLKDIRNKKVFLK